MVIRVAVRALETVHGSGLAPGEQAAEFDGVEQPYLATRCCYSWVFRHECGSPNGFELGFLLLRQRFWAGAAGLWFVPVLRRFFSGSRQFG